MKLTELKPGISAIVEGLACNNKLSKRLLALGFIEGTEIKVKMSAPLGDPIIISLRGTDFAIRKKDAKKINVKENY